jgi:hypothetical protein
MTSALLIALFVGLSIPAIGAGIALARGATAPDTVVGFASSWRSALPLRGGRSWDGVPRPASAGGWQAACVT